MNKNVVGEMINVQGFTASCLDGHELFVASQNELLIIEYKMMNT